MTHPFLLVTFFFVSFVSTGQTYSISPSNKLDVSAPFNEENRFKIHFTNISGESINLQWKVISNHLVEGWDCFICDNVSCCKGVPESGALPYIDPGITVYLALNVNPKTIPGIGKLKLYLHETGNPDSGDTLTWIVNSIATGLDLPDMHSAINIFPNPASEYVMIDMSNVHSTSFFYIVSLYNNTGQLLIEKRINSGLEKIDISALLKGCYQIVVRDDKGNRVGKMIVK